MNYKDSLYNHVKVRVLEDSLKTYQDVKKLIDKEFEKLSDPIGEYCKVFRKKDEADEIYCYQIYDRILQVEYFDDVVHFSRVPLSKDGTRNRLELIKIEFICEDNVFKEKVERQPNKYINNETIDRIFKEAFVTASALRY